MKKRFNKNKIDKNLRFGRGQDSYPVTNMPYTKGLINDNVKAIKLLRKRKDRIGFSLVVQKILYLFWRRIGCERGFYFEEIRNFSLYIIKELVRLCVKKIDELSFNLIMCLLEFFWQINCHIEKERFRIMRFVSKKFLKKLLYVRKYIYKIKVASFSNYESYGHKYKFLNESKRINETRKTRDRVDFFSS